MKTLSLEEKKKRIIARGEQSDHSHIIIGDCEIIEKEKETYVKIGKDTVLKHLIESVFLNENREQWTGEHTDADIVGLISKAKQGDVFIRHGDVFVEKVDEQTVKIIHQEEYNPYLKHYIKVTD